jgi:hypothetical protein
MDAADNDPTATVRRFGDPEGAKGTDGLPPKCRSVSP